MSAESLKVSPNPKTIGGIKISTLMNCVLGLAIFTGGFVTFEPAPYEVIGIVVSSTTW